MANMPGDTFVSKKGIKYILDYGPKGNLRPYTVGRPNPYIKGGLIIVVIATVIRMLVKYLRGNA